MITKQKRQVTFLTTVVVCLVAATFLTDARAAIDRGMILKEPGVFGIVATFKLRADWDKLSASARQNAAAEVTKLVDQHKDNALVHCPCVGGRGCVTAPQ